jgi:hypothetical protein
MICKSGEIARKCQFYRALVLLGASVAIIGTSAALTILPVQALTSELAAITDASTLDKDPLDFQAVAAVCTVCHAASQFLTTPRSSTRWQQVYDQMSGYGAIGTDDQLDRLVSYFQKNLTLINVNTSPADDLGPTLQVNDSVLGAIIARRVEKPFIGVDDLSGISGVDRSVLEKLSAKKLLQF